MLQSIDFNVYKEAVIKDDSNEVCTRAYRGLDTEDDPWPTKNGDYQIFIDKDGIEDGCKLMLFKLSREEDVEDDACKTAYATIDSNGGCVETTIAKNHGYGLVPTIT